MLLSIGLGTVFGLWLLGGLDAWECAALAAILAPTDAALGAAVVEDQRVPQRIRQALNVEAGLNDGLAVPFLLLFVAGATVAEGFEPGSFWATTLAEKVGIGLLAGVLVGSIAGELARRARAACVVERGVRATGDGLHGGSRYSCSPRSSAAAASLRRSWAAWWPDRACAVERAPALGFTDEEGAVVGAFVFFALGLFAVELFDQITWPVVAYAVLSLTIVRMLPVAIALIGSGLRTPTVAFIGWFGPRGLASVVLALVVLEEDRQLPHVETVVTTTLTTVILEHHRARPERRTPRRALRSLGCNPPARLARTRPRARGSQAPLRAAHANRRTRGPRRGLRTGSR